MVNITVLGPVNWIVNNKAVQLYTNEGTYIDDYSVHVEFTENSGNTIKLFDYRSTIVGGVTYDNLQDFYTALGINVDTI